MGRREGPADGGAARGWHLQLEHITLRRAGRVVLDDLTGGFHRGRVTAVVGPSGAGKTSLLRCLNRLEEPSSGRVLLDGMDVRAINPLSLRRRIGMVFQTPVLLAGNVHVNLTYGLERADRERLVAALEAAQLPAAFLDRDARQLSVGEAQRVAVARALVRDPEVLVADEPTSALDRDAGAGIEALMRDLALRGLSVVVVTHDLAQAERIADDAMLVVAGRLVATGPVGHISAVWSSLG